MNRLVLAAVLGMTIGLSGSGCAVGTKRVVVDERVQTIESPRNQGEEVSTITRRTTTTQSRSSEHRGLLSTTVHWAGALLAFPFRLIGGMLRLLF